MKRRLLWSLILFSGLVLLVRLLWLREYPVTLLSMEPTIVGSNGGEYVLVEFDRGFIPERFDLVVLQLDGHPSPLVKRVVGLPGESVRLYSGDLYIDGKLLGPEVPRPAPVLVFDDTIAELGDFFRLGSTEVNPWEERDGYWSLDAVDLTADTEAGMMFMRRELRDGYLLADGSKSPGQSIVHDVILGCEIRLDDPPAVVRLRVYEQGDRFEVNIEPVDSETAELRFVRYSVGAPPIELDSERIRLAAGRWYELFLSNVDNALEFRVDDRVIFSQVYEANTPHPRDQQASVGQGPHDQHASRSLGHRVSLGGHSGRASFRAIRVWRDLHYTEAGDVAVTETLHLGSREIFVLGDNSSKSDDGRYWGPLPLDSVIGRPLWVIWPPSRIRRLGGAERPAGYPHR